MLEMSRLSVESKELEIFSVAEQDPARRSDLARTLQASLLADAATAFVTRYRDRLATRHPELFAELSEAGRSQSTWLDVVPTHQAALLAAARGQEDDVGWVAAMMALALNSAGWHAVWRARFESVRTVRFLGAVSEGVAGLNVADTRFDGCPPGWRALTRAEDSGISLWLISLEDRRLVPIDVNDLVPQADLKECRDALENALKLVSSAAPLYLEWIAGAIDTVVPFVVARDTSASRSFDLLPGTVAIGFPADPITLGELLIHEASHVYLGLVQSLSWLSNQTDHTLYYSPFTRSYRPLVRLLVGFHAFANVAAYYDRLGGESRAAWRARWLVPMLECRDCIASSSGLTSAGLALFEPAAHLFE